MWFTVFLVRRVMAFWLVGNPLSTCCCGRYTTLVSSDIASRTRILILILLFLLKNEPTYFGSKISHNFAVYQDLQRMDTRG